MKACWSWSATFSFLQARVDFSALLPLRDNLGDHLAALGHVVVDKLTNTLAGQKRSDQGAGQVGTPSRFLGDAKE